MELSRCLEDHWVFQARCYCLSEISQQSNMRWEGYFLLIVFFKSSEYLYTISSHKRGPLLRMMVWDIWNLETSGWLILFVKMFSILALSTLLQSFWVSVCICMYTIVSIKIHQLSSIGGKKTVFCSCKTWWAFSKPGFNYAHVSCTLKIHQIFFFSDPAYLDSKLSGKETGSFITCLSTNISEFCFGLRDNVTLQITLKIIPYSSNSSQLKDSTLGWRLGSLYP